MRGAGEKKEETAFMNSEWWLSTVTSGRRPGVVDRRGLLENRPAEFMERGGFSRSWRFIGLIVTRARARAPRNFCPRENIFTPRDGTEPERKSPGRATETSMTAVKTPKSRREIYGLSLERSRFIGRRSRGELSGRGFRQNCTLDENTVSAREKRAERDRDLDGRRKIP